MLTVTARQQRLNPDRLAHQASCLLLHVPRVGGGSCTVTPRAFRPSEYLVAA